MTIDEAIINAVKEGYHVRVFDGIEMYYSGANTEWSVWTRTDNDGRSYGFGDWAKTNKASKRPLTQASLRCKRWLKPSSLQRIPTPLNRC